MLERIKTRDNIPDFVKGVKEGKERLMGFGHRVYKNYDPRARIIKSAAEDVFEVTGRNPLLDIALELEQIALEDDYFISRKLYPNVDFYSGLIYQAMRLPVAMFPVMFAIGRTSGWIAQWREMVEDAEQKISRPRQIYTGERSRDYVPIDQRSACPPDGYVGRLSLDSGRDAPGQHDLAVDDPDVVGLHAYVLGVEERPCRWRTRTPSRATDSAGSVGPCRRSTRAGATAASCR